jgi:hypothetical protein
MIVREDLSFAFVRDERSMVVERCCGSIFHILFYVSEVIVYEKWSFVKTYRSRSSATNEVWWLTDVAVPFSTYYFKLARWSFMNNDRSWRPIVHVFPWRTKYGGWQMLRFDFPCTISTYWGILERCSRFSFKLLLIETLWRSSMVCSWFLKYGSRICRFPCCTVTCYSLFYRYVRFTFYTFVKFCKDGLWQGHVTFWMSDLFPPIHDVGWPRLSRVWNVWFTMASI